MAAKDIQLAVARHFNPYQNVIIFNAMLATGEADVVSLSRSGYVTEVEVKMTLADWKRDATKVSRERRVTRNKHELILSGQLHRRFWFAAPLELWETAEAKLTPEQLPEWAGVLVYTKGGVRLIRRAAVLKAVKQNSDFKAKLLEKLYYKHWNTTFAKG